MPFVFRKLDRKARLYRVKWTETDDVQADALREFRTRENALSIWLIDDNRSNLERVIAAVAAGRDRLCNLDYALIEHTLLDELDIQVSPQEGESVDDDANRRWHQDLERLSATKVVQLAVAVQRTEGGLQRVQKRAVGQLIATSIRNGFINPNRIDERLMDDLADALQKLPPSASGA